MGRQPKGLATIPTRGFLVCAWNQEVSKVFDWAPTGVQVDWTSTPAGNVMGRADIAGPQGVQVMLRKLEQSPLVRKKLPNTSKHGSSDAAVLQLPQEPW